jgi:hypothetical protein
MLTLVCISIQQFDASLDIEGCPTEIGEIAVVHLQYFVAVDLVDEERMKKEKEKERKKEIERERDRESLSSLTSIFSFHVQKFNWCRKILNDIVIC